MGETTPLDIVPMAWMISSDSANNGMWSYDGGLTSPMCNEIVKWVVLEDPVPVGRLFVSG